MCNLFSHSKRVKLILLYLFLSTVHNSAMWYITTLVASHFLSNCLLCSFIKLILTFFFRERFPADSLFLLAEGVALKKSGFCSFKCIKPIQCVNSMEPQRRNVDRPYFMGKASFSAPFSLPARWKEFGFWFTC